MNAEIVTSGTELLLGETVDTNSAYIARALRDIGVNLYYKTSVGDNVERMAQVLIDGLRRSDLIIITGGLGPTVDDVTREAVAQATGHQLVLYPDCLAAIEGIFARWGRPMGENNRRQAYLPAGSIPIDNPVGTAPGFILESNGATIIALPGVPREMERLMQESVLPHLRGRLGSEQVIIKARTLRTVALGESWIDERLDSLMRSANPTVGLAAHSGIVDVRIVARAPDEGEADRMIAEMETEVRERLGEDAVFGAAGVSLDEVVTSLLAQGRITVALVESATGGEIARRLRTAPAGAGLVTAAHVVRTPQELSDLLGLSPALLDAYGWVSQMAATSAAAALTDTYEAGWGLAVLGDMETLDDVYGAQTGHTFVGLVTPDQTLVRHYPYGGQGPLSRSWVSLRVLDLLRRAALERLRAMGEA